MMKSKIFALALIISILAIAASSISVQAQSQGTIVMAPSTGGTTDPPAGTTTYDDGTEVTLTATPDAADVFLYWVISTTAGSNSAPDNPITLPIIADVEYDVSAVFQPITAVPGQVIPSNLATAAIVVVLPGTGGTTSPAPGTYALADATQLQLKATPASGWVFSHWVISGSPMSHGAYAFTAVPTDNPYTVDHGYGNTYNYQPVFTPTGTTEPTPQGATPTPSGGGVGGLSMETIIIIVLVVVIVIILIGFGVFASRKK